MSQTSNAINWPWVLRSRADAAYLGDTEGTVKLLQQAADYIESALASLSHTMGAERSIWEKDLRIAELEALLIDSKTLSNIRKRENDEMRIALASSQAVTEVTQKVLDDAYAWYSSTNHGSLDGIPFEHVVHVIDVMRLRVKATLTEGAK